MLLDRKKIEQLKMSYLPDGRLQKNFISSMQQNESLFFNGTSIAFDNEKGFVNFSSNNGYIGLNQKNIQFLNTDNLPIIRSKLNDLFNILTEFKCWAGNRPKRVFSHLMNKSTHFQMNKSMASILSRDQLSREKLSTQLSILRTFCLDTDATIHDSFYIKFYNYAFFIKQKNNKLVFCVYDNSLDPESLNKTFNIYEDQIENMDSYFKKILEQQFIIKIKEELNIEISSFDSKYLDLMQMSKL